MNRHDVLDKISNNSNPDELKVDPRDFATFLPWACAQLCYEGVVYVKKIVQDEVLHFAKKKITAKSKTISKIMPPESDDSFIKSEPSFDDESMVVRICATYRGEHLVHIKFEKTKRIPRQVLQVLGIVVKYYPHLHGISVNGGMDQYTVHEISKFVPLSNISEVDFDSSFCKEANYHILLDNCKNLQVLSLARCKIGDDAAIQIAKKLMYLEPASQTLSVLNLSSNRLTDKSVKHFANALRANRKLSYLNLASNSITDEGAVALLRTLDVFPLTMEESGQNRRQHKKYLEEKQVVITKIIDELRSSPNRGQDKKNKRISQQPQAIKVMPEVEVQVNKLAQIMNVKPVDPAELQQEAIFRERAEQIAVDRLGAFEDTFNNQLFIKDGWLYCHGNNTLAYLNIAYNNVSYITVKYLLKVLNYQKDYPRKPKGLVNVCLEGNPLPQCQELINIEFLLEVGLRGKQLPVAVKRRSSVRSMDSKIATLR